jgi:hypothetical protein
MNPVNSNIEKNAEGKPKYVPPMIKVMEEKDLLAEFQVSVNANSWWGAM